ncbi:MAG: ATP-dependent 6-phosphofructokinase [Promethearchaeota archaeon]
MKTIGVATTGGDAPGMNAAIRAVVRLAYSKNFQVLGFMKGWEGVINNTFMTLDPRSVSGIIHTGGTMLQTSRCLEFRKEEGRKKAAETLTSNNVDGLIVIGGNGTMNGALALSKETDTLIVGIPATIDNDVFGTEETVGFDTAVNTAVSEVDKIRDTAVSHDRIFVVEVMGRKRGFLALAVGIAVGAEVVLIPEKTYAKEDIIKTIEENIAKGKKSGIIVAAEGVGDNYKLAKELEVKTGSEVRLSVLGYAQRGGNATARSRLLAGLFANKAIDLLSDDQGNQVVGLKNGKITSIELIKSCATEKPLDFNLLKLANLLAT